MQVKEINLEEAGRRLQLDFDASMAQIKSDIDKQLRLQNIILASMCIAIAAAIGYVIYVYFTI